MSASSFDVHSLSFNGSVYNKDEEISLLKETKTGVKEVADAGITQLPNIFIYPKQHQQYDEQTPVIDDGQKQVPVIDLQGLQGKEQRSEIVSQIRNASETWGIFQLINHEVPQQTIVSLLESIKEFNEQTQELKSEFYTLDHTKKVQYHLTTHHLYKFAFWKDSLNCYFDDLSTQDFQALPSICRKPISDYVKCVTELKDTLSELLSEALGLTSDFVKTMGCMEASHLSSHYSPACPQPDLAMGLTKHSDPYFLTLLVQNHIDALQVLYENQWIDVNVKQGAIIVNIGDMLQIISNDIFKSVEHRVLVRSEGPRISSACFFHPGKKHKYNQAYGPIKELLEGDTAPAFTETTHSNYLKRFYQRGFTGQKALSGFRK